MDLAYRVKRVYYEYYLLGREVELTRENRELLRFWESVVRTRYKVGLQPHPDLIKAQVELALLDDRLAGLVDRMKPVAASLLSELHLPVDTELPAPGRLDTNPGPDAGRQIGLYRDLLLPQTEQLINATFTAYQAGESDFLSLLETQRQFLSFQLALDQALVTAAVELAELQMLSGYDDDGFLQ